MKTKDELNGRIETAIGEIGFIGSYTASPSTERRYGATVQGVKDGWEYYGSLFGLEIIPGETADDYVKRFIEACPDVEVIANYKDKLVSVFNNENEMMIHDGRIKGLLRKSYVVVEWTDRTVDGNGDYVYAKRCEAANSLYCLFEAAGKTPVHITDIASLKYLAKKLPKGILELHEHTGKKVFHPVAQVKVTAHYVKNVANCRILMGNPDVENGIRGVCLSEHYADGCFNPYVKLTTA